MSKNLKDTVKDAGDKVGEAIDKGKDKVQDAADKTKDSLQDLKSQADDNLAGLKSNAEDFTATAEDEFNRLYGEEGKLESLINFVRDRPFLSLGIAAFIGIILTKICRCCCHK